MNTHEYNTFWSIIKENKIEIPTIQRDYAYGRRAAKRIRTKLILDIAENIKANTSINLDFVYGKLLGKENQALHEKNKSNIQSLLKSIKSYATDLNVEISYDVIIQDYRERNNVTFIPLDGQQRLTTLYLLHWYFAQVNQELDSLKILKGFSYSTRISSKDFCKMLCENQFTFTSSSNIASDIIRNHEKYFSFWEKDPTVKSMLVVIDDIHSAFVNDMNNSAVYWGRLKSTSLISFDFFDLDDFELTDDLYIKMNARGKQLTNFENFKAWLIKDYEGAISVEDWKRKFDLNWTDLFWNYKSQTSYNIDDEFLQYFKILFLADYLKNIKTDDRGLNDEKELIEYTAEDWSIDDFKSVIAILRNKDSNPVELFKAKTDFPNLIDDYLHLLDYLNFDLNCETNNVIGKYTGCNLSEFIFGERINKYNWWDNTLHYAITRYLLRKYGGNTNFKEWVRVASNLIYNTKIDSPKLFIEAIKSIDALITRIIMGNGVYSTLEQLNLGDIDFFSVTQREEEIKKAKLIMRNNSWEDIFIKAENHPYFFGQVGFIFKLDANENDCDIFSNNFEKTVALFSEVVFSENTFLLTRTFLTQGDCFYHEGNNIIFNSNDRVTLRHRTENWRKFFNKYPDYIKKTINHEDFDSGNIITSLETIIKADLVNVNGQYIEKYINNFELFNYSRKNHIRKYEHGYYPLNSTRMSGYYVELNTYNWFLINKEAKENSDLKMIYNNVKGEDSEPNIEITRGSKIYNIKFDSLNNEFILTDQIGHEKFNSIDFAFNKILENGK